MGAYNWLKAKISCFYCNCEFIKRFQVRVGWCRYDTFDIGDKVIWMDAKTRKMAKDHPDLRTLVEEGIQNRDFVSSAGDHECPHCGSKGSVLVSIENDTYKYVKFVKGKYPYGKIFSPENKFDEEKNVIDGE